MSVTTDPRATYRATREASWTGLTGAEVAERESRGEVNLADNSSSRSLSEILRANVFTLFNAILTTALVIVLLTGSWQDGLFGFVLILNTAIGVVTEYRAKRTLDKLAILSADAVRVKRDGEELGIESARIVLGDQLLLRTGEQIPADAVVLASSGLEVDESMLTGESDPVGKTAGDVVLSGSFVVSGAASTEVVAVGEHAYANKLASQARKFSLAHSELRAGIDKILVVMTWIIIPLSLILMWSQIRTFGGFDQAFNDGTWRRAAVYAVAGVVAMVPDGLMLLTSMNFALAAIILARQQVLIQELPAVEILARVDVLCLDKTGTITDGSIVLDEVIELADVPGADQALAAIGQGGDSNATAQAIGAKLSGQPTDQVLDEVPFSSTRKWSAICTEQGTWLLGAPEILLANARADAGAVQEQVQSIAKGGARVVVLCHSGQGAASGLKEGKLPADLTPVRLVVLREQIRPDAAQTLSYFRDQGVDLKVISGDNPSTVAAIATEVDLAGGAAQVGGMDARDLPDADAQDLTALTHALQSHSVFGRVTPEQKRAFVHALQSQGRTVAMTGDGVNDALALKDADLGIAMGNGAPATKSVARVVLLNGKFSTLPGVVAQGRRVIANMERVANLFLVKMTYAGLLSILVILLGWPFPFLPRHLTLISMLTIGIPAFVLALAPNSQRYRAGFLPRVLRFAIPAGLSAGLMSLVVFGVMHVSDGFTEAQANTGATIVMTLIGLWIIGCMARPLNWWKSLLIGLMVGGLALALGWDLPREFFELDLPSGKVWAVIAVSTVLGWLGIEAVHRWSAKRNRGPVDVIS